MPRFPRLVVPGYPHHVTQRGVRKQTTFFDQNDYRTYLQLAEGLLDRWPIDFWAYCLMPNHMHAVVVPHEEVCLSKFFATLHRQYARHVNDRYEWAGHLWQKRFYSVVMDEPHTIAAMRYVEQNPVRAGLCNSAKDWPWSSASGNLELAADPLVDRSKTRDLVASWSEYLAEPEVDDQLDTIRDLTRVGRPSGSPEFLCIIESATGRAVRKKRAGRRKE